MNVREVLIVGVAAVAAGCGCSKPARSAAEVVVPEFSADSAFSNVAAQVAFGPRTGGSPAHEECGAWLIDELTRYGADTICIQQEQLQGFGLMTNICASFNSRSSRRILLAAHWDSRPWADEDPDPANHGLAIDGANDGASGVGVLLEVARLVGQQPAQIGVDILLVDAEDAGTSGNDDSWARGAQYFARNLPYDPFWPLPAYGVLLDMVGGRNAVFPREFFSQQNAPAVNNRVWAMAKKINLSNRFPDLIGGAINDDHLPLQAAGIPTIDIIETANPQTGSFNPTWHTMQDNLENIDRETLGVVGRLITNLIYNEK